MRQLSATAAIAALCLAYPAAAQVQPVMQMQDNAPIVTLNISESVESRPDVATIGAGVQTLAPTATQALRENSVKMDRLINALKARGIEAKDIQTTGINLNPQYDYSNQRNGQPPRFTGYMVSNQVRVKTREIETMGALLDALITAGGTNVDGPYFSKDNDEELKVEARTRALATARQQAQFYAQRTGYSSVELVSITESMSHRGGPIIVTQSSRGESADAVMNAPVEPGQIATSVNLSVQYRLVR